jgi:ATP-dependent DNA helicase RecG
VAQQPHAVWTLTLQGEGDLGARMQRRLHAALATAGPALLIGTDAPSLVAAVLLAASAALRRLRDAGLLVQKGRGSATYYVLAERMGLHKNTGENPGLSTHLDGLSGDPSVLSGNPGGLSSNLDALSSNPQPNEQDATRSILLDELPGSLAARLGGIGQRHPPQDIQNLIVDLCALRDWPVSELALLLRRNPENIRQSYLRPLMRDGRLTMTNPEEPNDPQQAYRAVIQNKN